MTTSTRTRQATGNGFLRRWRRSAWVLLVVADVGLGLWGLGAALIPH